MFRFASPPTHQTSTPKLPQMFARSFIRRQSYADVMAKTAANTKGDSGSFLKNIGTMGVIIGGACVALGLNTANPSTRKVSAASYYGIK